VLRIQFVRLEVLHESVSSGGAVVEGFLAQEVGAEVDHHESAILRKTHDHVVSHITLPAGSEVTSRGMRGDHRRAGDFHNVPKGVVRDMAYVNHDTQAVHLPNHVDTKLA